MERQVRYCTTEDGVRIAYCVEGRGPTLVICPYFFESFASDDDVVPWRDLMQEIGAGRHVVRYDMRGTGLSQRDGVEVSHAGSVRDLEAVVKATGLERFDLLSWVVTGPVAIEYTTRHPRSVDRMILYSTFTRTDEIMPADALRGLAALSRTNWEMASQTLMDISLRQEAPELALQMVEIFRQTVSGEVIARYIELDFDVTEILPSVKAPTLILHRVNDSGMPFATSRKLASLIPNARLAPLKGSVNYPALGDRQSVLDAIAAFLREGEPAPPEPEAPGAFRTVLFTDVEGSTALTQRLGDARARELLREHERMVREALKAHGGSEVKTMGDGFMASFSSATKALECAIAMQRAFSEHNESAQEPIKVRVGLNAGEPIAEEDDLFGTVVNLAARICAHAEAGQILAPIVVRELAAGKQFMFADLGETELRGFEDPVRLYDLRWREAG